MHEFWITEVHRGAHREISRVIAHENCNGPSLVNRTEFSVGEVVSHMLSGDKFFLARRSARAHGGFQKMQPVEYELTTHGTHKNGELEKLPEY